MSRQPGSIPLLGGAAAVAFLVTGCLPTGFVEPRIPAIDRAQSPDGSVERGRDILLNRTFANYGIPIAAMKAMTSFMPLEERIPKANGRRGLNRFIPIPATSMEVRGVPVVYPNCYSCHAGMVDGKLYLGLGNSLIDQTVDLKTTPLFNDRSVSELKLSSREREEFFRWRDYTALYAKYTLTSSPGTSSAVSITSFFLAHREPGTYAWSEKPFVQVPDEIVETDIPAWWMLKKKQGLYYGGEAKGNEVRHLMQFFSVPGNTLADLQSAEEDFKDVLAYIKQLEPPRYPYAVDAALSLQGQQVFEASCSSCHGTYGKDETYPAKVVPLWKVGTDPVRWEASRYPGAMEHYNRLWHGEDGARMEPTEGYVAPPLDGVWVTAPYLHNASVPSLADLLTPEEQRPRYFIREQKSRSYDFQRVGWKYEAVDHGKTDEPDLERRRRIYDTDQFGKSNRGHRFGTDLPEDQKTALIEYLKTL